MVIDIERIIALVLKDAETCRTNAGYRGWSDGGAIKLEDQVHFYRLGMEGAMPVEWKKYEHVLDPEYQEFLRLKAKFPNG